MVYPNHIANSGAKATFGAICMARMYGDSSTSAVGDTPSP